MRDDSEQHGLEVTAVLSANAYIEPSKHLGGQGDTFQACERFKRRFAAGDRDCLAVRVPAIRSTATGHCLEPLHCFDGLHEAVLAPPEWCQGYVGAYRITDSVLNVFVDCPGGTAVIDPNRYGQH